MEHVSEQVEAKQANSEQQGPSDEQTQQFRSRKSCTQQHCAASTVTTATVYLESCTSAVQLNPAVSQELVQCWLLTLIVLMRALLLLLLLPLS